MTEFNLKFKEKLGIIQLGHPAKARILSRSYHPRWKFSSSLEGLFDSRNTSLNRKISGVAPDDVQ